MTKFSRAVATQLLFLALIGGAAVWLAHLLPLVRWITQAQQQIVAMEFWGAVLYPLLYAGCNVLLLPAGVLSIGSGLFFGLWWGTFLAVAGNVIGAAIAFLISRRLGRAWLERKLMNQPRWISLDAAIRREGWKIIFLSQVHPLFPSSLLHYVYGVTSIRFWPCMLWVALGQLPAAFLYAYLGTLAQFGIRLMRGETHPGALGWWIWFGGLVVTVIVSAALGRLALRLLAEAQREQEPQNRSSSPSSPESKPPMPPERPESPEPSFLARLRKALTGQGSMLA